MMNEGEVCTVINKPFFPTHEKSIRVTGLQILMAYHTQRLYLL